MKPVSSMRLAATVMLARSGAHGGVEVFMVRRSARSAFAPDAFVFPGGTLDAQDVADAAFERTIGADDERVAREFRAMPAPLLPRDGEAPTARERAGLFVAALRELFEEAGILLARDTVPAETLARLREDVRAGSTTFAQALATMGVYSDASALHLFSHWITPPSEPRRYDTHFFVARAPHGQIAGADASETHDGLWIAPHDALARYRSGEFHLIFPTIKHLERIAPIETVDALLAFARSKPILTIVPDRTPDEGFELPASLDNAW